MEYSLRPPLRRIPEPPYCDWNGCWKLWRKLYKARSTFVNDDQDVRLCIMHGRYMESMSRKVKRIRDFKRGYRG